MPGMGRPKRLGQSKYDYASDEDTEKIVQALARGMSTPDVAARSGYSEEQVRDIRAQYFPTAGLAKHYLRSNALRLAKRVVEEANVEEAVDILSRPNIGVLDAPVKGAGQSTTSILTSIHPTHLGGVQVAVVTGAVGQPLGLPAASSEETDGWVQTEDRDSTVIDIQTRPPLPHPAPEVRPALPPSHGSSGGPSRPRPTPPPVRRRLRVAPPPPPPAKRPSPRPSPKPKPKKRK